MPAKIRPLSLVKMRLLADRFAQLDPILTIGDIGLDKYTIGEVLRISPEAPIPVVHVKQEQYKLGLAANVADNLQTLGVPTKLVGVVGDDGNGKILQSMAQERQIPTDLLRTAVRPTIVKERIMDERQQICRVDYEEVGPFDAETEKAFGQKLKAAGPYSAMILQDYSKGTLSEKNIKAFIKQAHAQDKLVLVDGGPKTPPTWYRGADVLKPNYAEALSMAQRMGKNLQGPEELALYLHKAVKVKMVVITLGGQGMAVYDGKTFKMIPTLASEVFDVSGAGDTAIAVLAASLVAGATIFESAFLANAASGVVVGKKGTSVLPRAPWEEYYARLANTYAAGV